MFEQYVIYYGGTAFAIAAGRLGYLTDIGDAYHPAWAKVPYNDHKPFEELLIEAKIEFERYGADPDNEYSGRKRAENEIG